MTILTNVLNDVIKSGTMSVVVQWLNIKSLTNETWQNALLYTLLGRVVYQGIIKPLSNTERFGTYQFFLDDVLREVTTVFVVEILRGGQFSNAWWTSLATSISGLFVYHFYVYPYLNPMDKKWSPYSSVHATTNDVLKHAVLTVVGSFLSTGTLNATTINSYLKKIAGFATYNIFVNPLMERTF